jgi:hypothetical protein
MKNNVTILEDKIKAAWEQVREATKRGAEDISLTQSALAKVVHLEQLKNQQIALDKSIEASLVNGDSDDSSAKKTVAPIEWHQSEPFISRRKKGKSVRPTEIRIGTFRKSIGYLNEIPLTVGNFLIEQGKVLPTLSNFIQPSNSGFEMSAKTERLISGQYMEIGDDKKTLLKKARDLLDICGYRTTKIDVLFRDGNLISI